MEDDSVEQVANVCRRVRAPARCLLPHSVEAVAARRRIERCDGPPGSVDPPGSVERPGHVHDGFSSVVASDDAGDVWGRPCSCQTSWSCLRRGGWTGPRSELIKHARLMFCACARRADTHHVGAVGREERTQRCSAAIGEAQRRTGSFRPMLSRLATAMTSG